MTPALKSSRTKTLLAVGICSLLVGGAAWSAGEAPQKSSPKKTFPEEASPQLLLTPQDAAPEKAPSPDKTASSDKAALKETAPEKAAELEKEPSQEAAPEKARALLDQVKKSELDREIATKQTEIDRLKEDQTKAENDTDALKKSLESTLGLITGVGEHLTTLSNDKRRLEHELAVSEAWIAAEQFKTVGLRALAEAQDKSLSALIRRAEQTTARSQVRAIEMEILQGGQQPPRDGHEISQTDLDKARKALAAAEAKAESEERLAHEAMKAAGIKMALAEAKATYAQRLADNDLNLEAAKAIAKTKPKPHEKSAAKPAPIATGPSVVLPKPPVAKGAAKTSKTPAATPGPSR